MQRQRLWLLLLRGQAPVLSLLVLLAVMGTLNWIYGVGLAAVILVSSARLLLPYRGGIRALNRAMERLAARDPTGSALPSVEAAGQGTPQDVWEAVARVLRQQEERADRLTAGIAEMERVLTALPDPLILIDGGRRVLRANPAATVLFGGPPERFPGRDLAELLRSPDVLAATDAVLAGGAGRSVDLALHQPVERAMSARIEPLGVAALSVPDRSRVLLLLYDHTRARRTEQMRSDFVANASHELKTPLSTLIGFIETLRGPARGDSEAHDRFLAIMQEQAARMARLVEDLLSLSRIELDEHVAPTGPVRIADLVRQVAAIFEIKAAGRRMAVVVTVAPDLPDIAGDGDELAQLLQNLIDNALKYGRPGTDVTITAAPSARLARGVAITVRDQGEGIAREHLPRLTERFYRVDTARSRAMGGTGLGLAIVKHIVSRHRGLLQIESEPGLGSAFTVHLRPAPRAETLHANGDGPSRADARTP